jgi:hypothetical protein
MKPKILTHKWEKQDGFRVHQCKHCGLIRYWDDSFKKMMYKTKWKIYYFGMPKCKRIGLCDKIETPTFQVPVHTTNQYYTMIPNYKI